MSNPLLNLNSFYNTAPQNTAPQKHNQSKLNMSYQSNKKDLSRARSQSQHSHVSQGQIKKDLDRSRVYKIEDLSGSRIHNREYGDSQDGYDSGYDLMTEAYDLYDIYNRPKVQEQLQNIITDQPYRELFDKIHGKMNDRIESLKTFNEKLEADNYNQANELQRMKHKVTLNQDLLAKKEEELKRVQEELDRRKVTAEVALKNHQDYEKELQDYKTKYFHVEFVNTKLEEEVVALRSDKLQLQVDKMKLEKDLQNERVTGELLRKNLGLADTALNKKLLQYDERMTEMREDNKVVQAYAQKVVGMFKDMQESQAAYLAQFDTTAAKVDIMEGQTSSMAAKLHQMEQGPIAKIDQNLNRLNETVTETLKNEIEEVKDNRKSLKTESVGMYRDFQERKTWLIKRVEDFGKELKFLREVREENFRAQIPYYIIIALSTICITVAFVKYLQ